MTVKKIFLTLNNPDLCTFFALNCSIQSISFLIAKVYPTKHTYLYILPVEQAQNSRT